MCMKRELIILAVLIVVAASALWLLWKPKQEVVTPICPSTCTNGCTPGNTACNPLHSPVCPPGCQFGCVPGTSKCFELSNRSQDWQCGSINGSYNIIEDVKSNDACFYIKNDNVILDCEGHTITGEMEQDSYAIYLEGRNDTIKNCVITNYDSGIFVNSSSDIYLYNVVTVNNLNDGILVSSSNDTSLERITSSNNSRAGIELLSSSNISLSGSAVSQTAVGVITESSNLTSFVNNDICGVDIAMTCTSTHILNGANNICGVHFGCGVDCIPCPNTP